MTALTAPGILTNKSFIIESIEDIVADYFDIQVLDLKKKCRHKKLIRAKHIARYLLRVKCKMKVIDVGARYSIGHDVVSSSCSVIKECKVCYPELYNDLKEIEKRLIF